ncbi:MAG: UpxY family transcription antiterminator [Bacteroides sp.]|nr:UpxY family transcription antiterminator [Bacteroides sp.]MCM1471460.1 UpxY family transcription antiterminator [Bacteroides sp.]
MKVFYNRTAEAADRLDTMGVESYIPTRRVVKIVAGKKTTVDEPVINSLMFFRTTADMAEAVSHQFCDKAMVYRHELNGRKVAAPISDREMTIFRLVVSSGVDGLEFFGDEDPRFRTGEKVRVIGGPLAGAEGSIVRIKGDRRMVVSIEGVCAVATAYIPQIFLEHINQS